MNSRPTLEEIARLAGVSRATVSRVVNGDSRVHPDTRERVERVVREQSYAPNAAARALVRRRNQAIGVAADEPLGVLLSHAYFPLLVQGIAEACERRGYSLVLSPVASHTAEGLRSIERGTHVDGIVVATGSVGEAFLARLDAVQLPFVLVGRHLTSSAIHSVAADNRAGGRTAVEHLLGLGYRRIATIAGRATVGTAVDRLQGYVEALAHAGIVPQAEWVVASDYTEPGGYRAMESLLAVRPRCEAVFCANDLMAIGALRAAREAGLRVPDDVAIVGFDDVPIARMVDPPLTTIRQPITLLGATAAYVLIDMLEQAEARAPHERNQVLPVELVVRGSCGAGPTSDPSGVKRKEVN